MRLSAGFLGCLVGLVGTLVSLPTRAAVSDAAFTESLFFAGPTHVTGLAWAPDGSNRLFYLRKNGQIRIVENGVAVLPIFATIAPIVTTSECGLIGIAFDPDFVTNQYLYVFVTVTTNEQQIIRFTANGNVGQDPTVIVSGLPTRGANHDGGAVGFGPDGKLYWSIGDNGNRTGVDLDLVSLAAKVGRANRDGSVPNDNPFVDGAGPNNDYIWARGFRNPFSFTFHPETEQLWVDVTGDQYEQVFVVGAGDHAGWDNYQSNQPVGYIPPVISYRNDAVDVRPITAASRQGGVATFTTSVAHRFRPGAKIAVAGVTDPSFDATGFVSAVPSPTEFSFVQVGSATSSTGGTATSQAIGGALTGGTFWDSSGVPAAYRGNFYFGDYNTGRLMRTTFNGAGEVASVDEWGNGIVNYVDMDVGPDGALYYVPTTGNIYRASYNFSSQALLVSRLHVRMAEGGGIGFAVRLAVAPPQARSVTVQLASGDADVSVSSGATLSFSTTNWDVPQAVRLAAAQDADSTDDQATFSVSSNGLTTETVRARVTDDDAASIILSTTSLAFSEGGEQDFLVSLSEAPAGPVTISVSRSQGDSDVTVEPDGLDFDTSNWATPQVLTVRAGQDDDVTDDAATLSLAAVGFPERTVVVSVDDDDDSAPIITSTPLNVAVLGAPYAYDVDADGHPSSTYLLDEGPPGMTIDQVSGLVAWTPPDLGGVNVIVRAANGVEPDAVQGFVIEVNADQPPTCELTAPMPGAVLSGQLGEFFGDVYDDVGAVGATFSVDGVDLYADVGSGGHYHFGGAHNSFDTTVFADGEHTLRMTGEDTKGQMCSVEVAITIDNGFGGEGGAPGGGGVGGTSHGSEPEPSAGADSASAGDQAVEATGGMTAEQGGNASVGEPSGNSGGSSDDGGCGCRSGRSTGGRLPAGLGAYLVAGLLFRRRAARRPSR